VENHDHHHFNSGAFGLGLYLIARNRRLERERAAEEPYRRAEHAAWWAGLTPDQKAAYEAELRRQQAVNVPVVQGPGLWRQSWRFAWRFTAVVMLFALVAGAVDRLVMTADDRRAWCYEKVNEINAGGLALDWCVENYSEARRIWGEVHQGD
jgi:hypothetical protein